MSLEPKWDVFQGSERVFRANPEEAPSFPFGDINITQHYPYAGISRFKCKDEKIKYNLMR